ncbi:hypothetical protein [Agarivorans sp. QJM3NY_33]|uniref:hypothetical protein n=1 Tax=Agarivorans sp. QJM3NY_33 TaxID=3421432 RepID=UPI003D7E01CE
MNPTQQHRYHVLHKQHLTNLTLQGKRPATIDAYSRAVRRISAHFDRSLDILSPAQVGLVISMTQQARYQVFFLVLYSMGLRLSEALHLTIHDIDRHSRHPPQITKRL